MRALSKDNRRVILNAILFTAIATLAVISDQITKNIAVERLKPIGSYPLWKGVFELTYCTNTGAAFSMLSDKRWILISVTVIAMLLILAAAVMFRKASHFFFISLGMISGGGVGNMIDRLISGYVVDFFDFTLINFAIFNVADIFICVGAALLAFDILFIEKQEMFDIKLKKDTKKEE